MTFNAFQSCYGNSSVAWTLIVFYALWFIFVLTLKEEKLYYMTHPKLRDSVEDVSLFERLSSV